MPLRASRRRAAGIKWDGAEYPPRRLALYELQERLSAEKYDVGRDACNDPPAARELGEGSRTT